MKKSVNISVAVSTVLAIFVLAAFGLMAVFLPRLVAWYCSVTSRSPDNNTVITAIVYLGIVPAVASAISLLRLLGSVKRGEIFTPAAVGNVRFISLCCFLETVIFAVLSYYFIFSLILVFAAFFLGMILRVVGNVLQTAMEVKRENDFTI